MPDVDLIANEIVPVVTAAVAAYGTAVLTQAEDAAAGATVGLGQRILKRLLHRAAHRTDLETAVTDLATDTEDPDAVAALRWQIRKILHQEPQLAAELAALRHARGPAVANAPRAVAVGGDNKAPITTGDHSPVIDLG